MTMPAEEEEARAATEAAPAANAMSVAAQATHSYTAHQLLITEGYYCCRRMPSALK
jgi:hypothetical protein